MFFILISRGYTSFRVLFSFLFLIIIKSNNYPRKYNLKFAMTAFERFRPYIYNINTMISAMGKLLALYIDCAK